MQKKTLLLTIALLIGASFFIGVNFVKADATTTASITVIFPNGGETFTAGSVQIVRWSYNQSVINASSTFNIYLVSEPGTTTDMFTIGSVLLPAYQATSTLETDVIIPLTAGTGLYKILITNSSGGATYSDYSDNYFTITAPVSEKPDLTVDTNSIRIIPKTEDVYGRYQVGIKVKNVGNTTSSLYGALKLIYGTNYENIRACTIGGCHGVGNIYNGAILMSFLGKESLAPNEEYEIIFNKQNYLLDDIEFEAGVEYLFKVIVDDDQQIDESNESNNIIEKLITPLPLSITVVSPNGGENWVRGTQQIVMWDGSNAGGTVGVHLIKDPSPYPCTGTGESCFAGSQWVVPNTGSFTWTVGQVADDTVIRSMPNGSYRFQVCHSTAGCDSSNGTFNIVSTTTPSITVRSPNGGEAWNRATVQSIKWSTVGIPTTNNMTVRLRSMATNQELLSFEAPNTGSALINIPADFAVGSYKAEVKTAVNNASYSDASDSSFKIVSDTNQPWCSVNIPSSTFDASSYQMKPRLFNIDFGVSVNYPIEPKYKRTGAAVVGSEGDSWNAVAVPWCDDHTKTNLKNADNSRSPITVEMKNLGGSWSTSASLDLGYIRSDEVVGLVKNDTMLDNFNYPAGNKGGNSYIILYNVPIGSYDLYLYNKTANPGQYGDYTVTVGDRSYGHKLTSSAPGSEKSAQWEEGNQYVKIPIEVKDTRGSIETVKILIQPHVGVLRDAQIGGLQLAPTGVQTVTPVVQYESPVVTVDQQISDINKNSTLLYDDNLESILAQLNQIRDIIKEQQTEIKYLRLLVKNVQGMTEKIKDTINNFITYGVDENTEKLGAGERAAVINSYKVAFAKLPSTEAELADAIKIANGRFPSITSGKAEKAAKEQFIKIYKRIPDLNDANDNAAIKVMAYGLRQKAQNRNLNSEKFGIKTFQSIYGATPKTTEDWNAMQAIAYSGASREKDSDGDLLTDAQELRYGTNPNKSDTDGDGYIDGREVLSGYSPL